MNGCEVSTVHLLQPDSLPDACYRSIPDAFGVQNLFATWRVAFVGVIRNGDRQLIFRRAHKRSNVQRKRTVAAGMPSGLPSVYKYCAGIIHCAEMQQRTLGCVVSVDGKRAEIPERLARQNRLFNAGQRAFRRKRDADAALPYGRLLRTFRNGVLPQAV